MAQVIATDEANDDAQNFYKKKQQYSQHKPQYNMVNGKI